MVDNSMMTVSGVETGTEMKLVGADDGHDQGFVAEREPVVVDVGHGHQSVLLVSVGPQGS